MSLGQPSPLGPAISSPLETGEARQVGSVAKQVTLFARVDTARNPYILLYKNALERQGFVVHLEREFGLNWLLTRGRASDAVHLHWIEATYVPSRWDGRANLIRRIVQSRFVSFFRGALRLADVAIALLLAKLQGKIVVYTVHNLESHHRRPWPFRFLNSLAHHIVFFACDHIHAHNHYARQILEAAYKVDGIIVVPHGNYVGYYANHISRAEARQQLGLPEDAFVYLFLGMVQPYKGVEELIVAFRELDLPMARLLIAGRVSSGRYEETIRSLSQDSSAIRLVPEFVPDEALQLYMNACDICVFPYKETTTSGSAVLALSFGRPVIAPAIACFPELVTPETGVLYDPCQPTALASALRQATRRSWSESRILDHAHQSDWDTLGPQLARLYERA